MDLGVTLQSIVAGGDSGDVRPLTYCLVPAELAPKLHDALREHFAADMGVEVVVERRAGGERRTLGERRTIESDAPGEERRKVRAAFGRRVAERRVEAVSVEPLPLPRKARRYAAQLKFVRRIEPASQRREDLDTARVVRRFQAGDREAFGILYKRYFERIYNYMKVVLRDSHEAEDATQEVFAKALAGMKAYEQRDRPFRAWLFAIVRNHAIATLRKLGRLEPMDPADLERERETEGTEEQELPVLNWIADRDLVLFVERLPLPQQQVLLLRFLLDLSNEDIARAMNLTQNHVRVLQTRALDFLRERLTAIGREPKNDRRAPMARCPQKARVLRERRFALWD